MCFSPEASFTAGAVLMPAGAYCLSAAWRKDRSQLAIAAIPLFFAIQQFAEGVVWLGLRRHDPALVTPFALLFLFFALAFWPFWVPLSAALVERRPRVRRLLIALTAMSLVWFCFMYAPLVADPVRLLTTHTVNHSIQYDYRALPAFQVVPQVVVRSLYFLNIAVPGVLGFAHRGLSLVGLLLVASAIVAQMFFSYAYTSVWCLFAAGLSVSLCYAFWRLPSPSPTAPIMEPVSV